MYAYNCQQRFPVSIADGDLQNAEMHGIVDIVARAMSTSGVTRTLCVQLSEMQGQAGLSAHPVHKMLSRRLRAGRVGPRRGLSIRVRPDPVKVRK